MTATMVKKQFGFPFDGYMSSVPPHMAPQAVATSDGPSSSRRSQNFLYNPLEQKFLRRSGIAAVGSTTGILEDGSGEIGSAGRCRRLMSLRSPSLTDGYPTRASLWTDESAVQGCVAFFSTNGGNGDTVLGDEFSTTTNYPITEDGGVPYSRCWPYIVASTGTTGRFHSLTARALMSPGARNMIEVGDALMLPNLDGVPWYWRKAFNDTNAGTNVLRVVHSGRPGPIGIPTIASGPVGTDGSWVDTDVFYISVMYVFADGSVSMPIIPRPNTDDGAGGGVNYDPTGAGKMSGWGKVQLAASHTNNFRYLTWSNIPIGPDDVIGRYLLRSPKKDATSTTDPDPDPFDLRITAYIPNNTQTSFQDVNGNDLGLTTSGLVRFDHIMQPPSRYMGSVDGRILCGYTKPHPVAMYIAPFKASTNIGDGDAQMDDEIYSYSLTGGALTLSRTTGGSTTTKVLNNAGGLSLQQLIDIINNTVDGGGTLWTGTGGGKWSAVHAPGADLAATVDDVGTSADNDNLVSITGGTNFSGDGNGIIRAWSTSLPAPVFWSSVYLGNYKTNKRRIFFTAGGPGTSHMSNQWVAGNYRDAPENYGDFMGSAPLINGTLCFFSKGIMVLQNRKAGISGEDDDYRLYELNAQRGCLSWSSVTAFNGVGGCLTRDGYMLSDGREEVIISSAVWNAATQTGEWAYEIGQCELAAAADSDLAYFHASVMGGKLYVAYRLTSGSTTPQHHIVYDFSGSAQFSGLRGALREDGRPWGWSTPCTFPVSGGQFAEVVTASGLLRYTAMDGRVVGMTSTGRIYQVEVGPDDNGIDFTSKLWSARYMSSKLKRQAAHEAVVVYKKNATGLTLTGYRDGLGTTSDVSISLPSTSTDNLREEQCPMANAMRSPAKTIEWLLTDDGTGSNASEFWGMSIDVEEQDSYF